MVSRSETARQLLTPGEIMQLPPSDEIVMVAGTPPIRAKKARYYEDARFRERLLSPPDLKRPDKPRPDDWSSLPIPTRPKAGDAQPADPSDDEDTTDSERRLQPELSRAKPTEKKEPIANEFEIELPDESDEDATRNRRLIQQVQGVARQVSLDPNDGMEL